MEWNCRVSSSSRRFVRLRGVTLASAASKRCPLPLTRGGRLQEVINVEV